jgi:hypothetical protein
MLIAAVLACQAVAAQQGVPIVDSVRDEVDQRTQADTLRCIQADHDLQQRVEDLNGTLFHMETQRGQYDVRHRDRMEIMALIQRELTPFYDQLNHAVYHALPGGSGKYCDQKLKEGVALANTIYDANLAYRKRPAATSE